MNVTIKVIPEEAVDKSGSIRFVNITAEEFITPESDVSNFICIFSFTTCSNGARVRAHVEKYTACHGIFEKRKKKKISGIVLEVRNVKLATGQVTLIKHP